MQPENLHKKITHCCLTIHSDVVVGGCVIYRRVYEPGISITRGKKMKIHLLTTN